MREVQPDVEHPCRVESIVLRMQAVAAILHRHEQVFRPEGEVVEARVIDIAQEEQRQRAGVVGRPALRELEEPAEASELASGLGVGIDRKSTRLNSSHVSISYAV